MLFLFDIAGYVASLLLFFIVGVYLCEVKNKLKQIFNINLKKLFFLPGRITNRYNLWPKLLFAITFSINFSLFELVILDLLGFKGILYRYNKCMSVKG